MTKVETVRKTSHSEIDKIIYKVYAQAIVLEKALGEVQAKIQRHDTLLEAYKKVEKKLSQGLDNYLKSCDPNAVIFNQKLNREQGEGE